MTAACLERCACGYVRNRQLQSRNGMLPAGKITQSRINFRYCRAKKCVYQGKIKQLPDKDKKQTCKFREAEEEMIFSSPKFSFVGAKPLLQNIRLSLHRVYILRGVENVSCRNKIPSFHICNNLLYNPVFMDMIQVLVG